MSPTAGKDIALLDSRESPDRTDSITERIARLKRAIARGKPVYTADELAKLGRMLDEYERLLEAMTHG